MVLRKAKELVVCSEKIIKLSLDKSNVSLFEKSKIKLTFTPIYYR